MAGIVELFDENFDMMISNATYPVFVKFWAPWCGPCKLMAPLIEELTKERHDVLWADVNVDNSPGLASRFSILSIPTFVILNSKGDVLGFTNGSKTKEALNEFIDKSLGKA